MKEYVKCTGYSGNPSIPAGTCAARKQNSRQYERCVSCAGGTPIPPPAGLGEPVLRNVNVDMERYKMQPGEREQAPVPEPASKGIEISKSKRCTLCGQIKPLDDFEQHHRAKDRHKRICMECNGKIGRTDPATKEQNTQHDCTEPTSTQLILDFGQYPEMMSLLLKTAKKEFRSPVGQVLYCLSQNQCSAGPMEKRG
jgi:hypothetical protein